MSYITKVVNTTSTECEFITEFVNQLTATDSRIICNTDITAQFDNEEKIPSIDVLISGIGVIRFVRTAELSNISPASYRINFIINNNEYINLLTLGIIGNSSSYSAVLPRTLSFSMHTQQDFLILRLFNYNKTDFTKHDFQCIAVTETNFRAVSTAVSGISASKSNFIRTDSSEEGRQYLFATRIPYTQNGSIEIIKSKVLTTNNNLPHVFVGFYDCSTVAKDSIVTIDGTNYYALDEHTLAPIGGD